MEPVAVERSDLRYTLHANPPQQSGSKTHFTTLREPRAGRAAPARRGIALGHVRTLRIVNRTSRRAVEQRQQWLAAAREPSAVRSARGSPGGGRDRRWPAARTQALSMWSAAAWSEANRALRQRPPARYTLVMTNTRQRLEALLELSRDERSEIAEALLQSLDGEQPEPGLVGEWAAEIMRRIERNAPGIPAELVLAEGRARLKADG